LKSAEILRAEGQKQAQILEAEGRREAAYRDAEARERAAEAEARATQVVSEAIASGTQALNYFVAQKYVEAVQQFAVSPNAKTILFPVEATQLIGSLGGIGELIGDAIKPRPTRAGGQAGGGQIGDGPCLTRWRRTGAGWRWASRWPSRNSSRRGIS
jgi:hypothetical protein